MVALRKTFGEGPVPLRQIADEQRLSEAYLEQFVSPLRNSGISEKCTWSIRRLYACEDT